ncbi:MAG: PepSY-associated TM helix domain-containing protein [Ewingella sp.]|uniref:PepSY-associated TM helix domain-containing protein n=1 Tax=Ewingella TaxID=41201 RepID=UPI0033655669
MSHPASSTKMTAKAASIALLKRIHFYIGLFVGPFIFVAALTGTLYVLTPQLENHLYANELFTSAKGDVQPISRQIEAALAIAGDQAKIAAIRPAPALGETTRVMLSDPSLGASKTKAIFVDPVTLDIKGEETVYGTSGILPLRTWLDELHRELLLGDIGRNYSELAASWLWVAALGGILLWATSRQKTRGNRKLTGTAAKQHISRRWHTWLGITLLVGMLFLSVTGLTWSQWAGSNISILREHMGWMTPSVATTLAGEKSAPAGEHAEHQMSDMSMADMPDMPDMAAHHMPAKVEPVNVLPITFDQVIAAARHAGITANKIEIRPAYTADKAWTVTEVDRSWPTQVDAVSVNPQTMAIIDHTEFAHFPLLAKLTRWGVDAHMGILFGFWNQAILVLFGIGLCVMIGWGYRMWWLRRPAMNSGPHPVVTLIQTWRQLPASLQWPIGLIALALSISLPVMGVSLLIFLLIDVLRWLRHRNRLQAVAVN